MPAPILATKLYILPPRPTVVPRPRVIDRLNEGIQAGHRLTLISAPAGFGKSTLVSEWIETVVSGLGNGNGEILGGLWVLLVSVAALRTGGLPRGLNVLGLLVGAVGIISLVPGLTDLLTGVFGLSQIIWFVWLGIVLLCSSQTMIAHAQKGFAGAVSQWLGELAIAGH